MSLNYVTLTCDLLDGQGNFLDGGGATFTPSVQLTDSTDHEVVTRGPLAVAFKSTGSPAIKLLATDNASVLPAGWAWTVTFSGVSGSPAAQSYNLQAGPVTFTATNASPCIFTAASPTGQPWVNGMSVTLSGASLPAGFSAGTRYYLTGTSGSAFSLAATQGGAAIASASAGSGNVTVASVYLSQVTPVATAVTTFPLNPMTTAGDIIYGGSSPAGIPERLAGNAGAWQQTLVSAGDGSTAGAPSWMTVTERDIRTFGAKLDARPLSGISVSGTALTSAAAQFTAADVGRTVVVYNVSGPAWNGVTGQAVVSAYISPTALTLATSIPAVSGTSGAIGTDDTAAWQAAVNWAYAQEGGAKVSYLAGNAISLIAGPQVSGTVTDPTHSTTYSYSGQLLLPAVQYAAGVPSPSMEISSLASAQFGIYYQQDTNQEMSGLVLLSTAASGSMIDVIPIPEGLANGPGAFSGIQFFATGVTFRTPQNAAGGGPAALSLIAAACCRLAECSIDVDVPGLNLLPAVSPGPSSNTGTAVILPGDQNWAMVEMRSCQVVGYPKGIVHSEHAVLDNVLINSCGAALAPGQLQGLNRQQGQHGAVYLRVLIQQCRICIEPLGLRSVSGTLEIEPPWDCLIDDPNLYLSGDILVGGTIYANNFVRSCSSSLSIRSTRYHVNYGNGATAVNDALNDRLTGPTRAGTATPFGQATVSGHTWALVGTTWAIDAAGAYPNGSGGWSGAYIQNCPQWTSRRVAATVKTSAGITNAGVQVRSPFGFGIFIAMKTGNGIQVGTQSAVYANIAATIAPSTTHTLAAHVQSNALPGSPVVITVYLDGAEAGSVSVPSADLATYTAATPDGLWAYTGSGNDDGGTRVTGFSVTQGTDLPYVAAGTVTLSAGTVSVANAAVTAAAKIRVWNNGPGGSVGALYVSLTPGTGFTVSSTSSTDASTVYYEIARY